MRKKLIKGNEAVVVGALLAHCDAYYGYPITPASEIAHLASSLFPAASRTFIQAESEVAAINMVYGASCAGARCLTASSGPGISLKMEGVSYLAAAELPAVIVDVSRVGPGLGNIYPDQSDYNQIVKGGGHGAYCNPVLAPNSVQEMCDFTMRAFELADRYRTPVFVLSDACVGQMMEPLALPDVGPPPPEKPWRLDATAATNDNVITSIFLDADEMEAHIKHLQEKYAEIERDEAMCETVEADDADLLLVGFGIVSRVLRSVVDMARAQGMKVGLFRPKTLWPFPAKELRQATDRAEKVLVVELSNGQMHSDIRLIADDRQDIELLSRIGGHIPSTDDILDRVRKILARGGAERA